MNEQQLQYAFYAANHEKFVIVAPNIYLDYYSGEADICCLRKNGYLEEIEIKLTKADFNNDFKKMVGKYNNRQLKHDALAQGKTKVNRFSFLLPYELAEDVIIPEHAGLYVLGVDGYVNQLKRGRLLHKNKIGNDLKFNIGRKMAYRYWQIQCT